MKEGNDRIVTDDFTLRPWEEEDAGRLAFIANNKKIADNLRDGFPYPYSIDDARKFIHLVKHSEGISKAFVIVIDSVVAGSIAVYFKENILAC
ncbi:MAG TPA: GNAT family N-acetyltransferase [Methanomethylovorans sp.]|uniref:GNAT family N-acetyltransferase n=1 Tax=Methanomethylovorans sp. TaxID=2758717 RepID=UPI002D0A8526|nr:GNAT family N-acetyltransferase [Methanomethylovorans sp.]